MKIFLDADILITVLNKEYPLFSLAARIMSLHDNKRFKIYTSSLSLAIAFYFSEKKSGKDVAMKKIALLASKMQITGSGSMEVKQTIENRKISDFEDGLDYYSALNSGCDVIITEDTDDFYFAEIEVLSCRQFLEKLKSKEMLQRP